MCKIVKLEYLKWIFHLPINLSERKCFTEMPKSKMIRVIPDRVFYKLWKAAEVSVKIYEFIDSYTSPLSGTYIDFRKKYKLEEIQTIKMLENIYNAAHLSIKDIIEALGKKKAEIGYIFCINIRTLEDWCTGKNKSPSYVRLMMIRKFELLNLGKYIYLESDNHIVYNAYKSGRVELERKNAEIVMTENNIDIDNKNDYRISNKNDYMMSLKEYEQLHVHNSNNDIRDIIAATDYLRDYMKK